MADGVSKTEIGRNRVGRPKGLPRTGGRKPGTPNKATADVRAMASQYGPAALKELARLSEHAESEAARVAAAREILDRAYGRSPQPLTGEGGEGPLVCRVEIVGVPAA